MVDLAKNTGRWMRWLVVACVAAAAAAAMAAQSDVETLATGTWYGEFLPAPDKPLQRFLATRKPDGSYVLQVRVYEKGKPTVELRNAGLWGVSNGLYFTMTTEVNGMRTDPKSFEVTNPYVVRSLTAEAFEYQHVPSGTVFRVVRVDPATARLPD